MKTLQEFIHEYKSLETIDVGFGGFLNEDDAPAATSTAGVANPDSPPIFNKSKFAGHPCVEVDDDTYSNMVQGKQKFARWAKYVSDPATKTELQKMYNSNKKMLIKNSKTGGMVFIK